MTITKCDTCGFEMEAGLGIRVTQYGTDTGITIMPRYKHGKRVIEVGSEKHFCSGACLIEKYDYLSGVPALNPKFSRADYVG